MAGGNYMNTDGLYLQYGTSRLFRPRQVITCRMVKLAKSSSPSLRLP